MSLYDKRKEKIIGAFKRKEYRDAFSEEHIDTGIPFQIRALRDERGLSKRDLQGLSGINVSWSSRLENPNNRICTLSNLKTIASIYDIGLMVRFVPLSDLVEWELNLNTESLKVLSYDQDPYFK